MCKGLGYLLFISLNIDFCPFKLCKCNLFFLTKIQSYYAVNILLECFNNNNNNNNRGPAEIAKGIYKKESTLNYLHYSRENYIPISNIYPVSDIGYTIYKNRWYPMTVGSIISLSATKQQGKQYP